MTEQSLEARLVALETQVAQNQRTIDDLNDVVRQQGEEIAKLKSEVEVLGREILIETEGEAGPLPVA